MPLHRDFAKDHLLTTWNARLVHASRCIDSPLLQETPLLHAHSPNAQSGHSPYADCGYIMGAQCRCTTHWARTRWSAPSTQRVKRHLSARGKVQGIGTIKKKDKTLVCWNEADNTLIKHLENQVRALLDALSAAALVLITAVMLRCRFGVKLARALCFWGGQSCCWGERKC